MTTSQQVADDLRPDGRAHGLLTGSDVEIHPTARIGANVVIYSNTVIAADAVIKHNVVLGGEPILHKNSRSERLPFLTTTVGEGAAICNNAIVMAGASLGACSIVGDAAYVRERVVLGQDCVIARGCGLGAGAQIGARVNIQTLTLLSAAAVVEDDVFVGPGVVCTADRTIARRSPHERTRHILRRRCRIGGGVVLAPGVEIGEEAFVGAGAVVTRNVAAREKVKGIPARLFGSVGDDELLDRWR